MLTIEQKKQTRAIRMESLYYSAISYHNFLSHTLWYYGNIYGRVYLLTKYLSSLKIRCRFLFIISFIIFNLLFKSYRTLIDIDPILSRFRFPSVKCPHIFSLCSHKNLYHLLIIYSVFTQYFSRHPL